LRGNRQEMEQQAKALKFDDCRIYQTEDGRTRIQVRLEDETVWLTQKLMAELF